MGLIHILILPMLSFTGFLMQKITLEVQSHSASCESGYRHGIDTYVVSGTLGPNYITYLKAPKYFTFLFYIEILSVGGKDFVETCMVAVGEGQFCNKSYLVDGCHCNYFDNVTQMVYFKFYHVVNMLHNYIRVSWNKYGKTVILSPEKKIPRIYDVTKAVLKLYMNEQLTFSMSELCHLLFVVGTKYTLRLCCSESAMPCFTRIAFNATTMTKKQSPCTNYTFTAKNETLNISVSYSVCESDKYIQAASCLIKPTAPKKNEVKDLNLILVIVLGLGMIVFAIISVITCCCVKHRNKATNTKVVNVDKQ